MHYEADTSGIRDAKEKVDEAKRQIEIAAIEKEIDLLEDQKDLLNEQIDLLDERADAINKYYDEQIKQTEKFYDTQIKALEKQRKETEAYYGSLTKSLEQRKEKFQELTELLEKAELSAKLKQLGIDEEALLNGSEEEFEKLKNAYMDIVFKLNEGNDEVLNSLRELSGYDGTAPAMLSDSNSELDTMNENLTTSNTNVGNVNSSLGETATTTSDVASNVGDISTNLTEANGLVTEETDAFSKLKQTIEEVIETINQKTEAIEEERRTVGIATSDEMANFLLLKDKILEVRETLESFGTQNEGVIHDIALAIESLNDISLDVGLITQFNNLKDAIDSVTAAIGGGESSANEGSGNGSGSGKGGESGGKGSKSEGGISNSLTGAIKEMGETANVVIGEPDSEGDGTVIGEFGSMETAVNDVRDAIGSSDSEGGSGGSGSESDDTLVGSIEYLGDKTEEEMGEPDGDGIIGKFNEFKGVIEEAANQVKSISDGLDEIDGKEVECTITVNVKMNGSIPAFASGTVLDNMQIESASYNAKYGKAFASGTIGLPHAEKNALVSEYGQTEMTVLPDGKTIITDTPTLMDLPKDTVIYNEEETKKIMDNKIDVSGNAHADGTGDDGAPLYPSQETLDFMERMKRLEMQHELIANYTYGVLSPLHEIKQNTENMINNISNVSNVTTNNKNVQQPVTVQIGDINLTGVQDVSGLAQAIKTRLPNAMLQEIHRR